ncbi:MAG: phage portal protein, partial [Janthinobacterium lividum]
MIDRAAQKAARAAQASLRAASVPAKAAPAPKGRIAYDSVAASRLGARKPETASAWRVTPALPGVLPDATVADKQPLAMDYAPLYTSMGAGEFGGVGDGQAWLGFPLLSELAQRPEYRSVSETVAREMVRKWITLHSTGDDDKTDRIAAIMAGLERFKVRDTFRRLAEHDGFFGRGHLFIDTGDSDDAAEMQTPLVLDKRKIRKGSIKALKAVEPIWCYPAGYNATNPLAPDFYHPPIWYTNGRPVHRSRLLTFVGREVPDILKPAYQFGGVSMSQLIKPAVDNWLRVRESVGALVCAFSVFHLTTDMTSTLTGQGGDQLYLRAQMFNNYRSNDGLMITDKATEDFGNVSANLSTLDKLQAQSQEHIASIAKIPLVIYTGIGPTGLNASSEGDMEVWATNVQSA